MPDRGGERWWVALGLALCVTSCGGAPPDDSKPGDAPAVSMPVGDTGAVAEPGASADPAEAGYAVIDVTDGGSIRGTVRHAGTLPEPRAVAVADDTETCGASRQIHLVQVGLERGLANAVASLVDIDRGAARLSAAAAPTLDQRECEFTPHVVLVPAGDTVRVRNSDPLAHNVHTAAFENRSVNRTQPRGSPEIGLAFATAEKVRVKCDVHPWMSAWIVVTNHPYFAITDRSGSFSLDDVPPGTYTLEIWHETLGAHTQSVTVVADQTTDVTIELTGQG